MRFLVSKRAAKWPIFVLNRVKVWDHYTFLGNCPTTPPLSQHFRWAVSQKRTKVWRSLRNNQTALSAPPPREGQRNGTSVSHSQSIETYQLTYFFSVVKAVWIWISWHQSLLLFCLPFSIYLELIVHFVLIKCAFGKSRVHLWKWL